MAVLNTAIFNLTYSGGMDVPELRLNLGGKRIGPQKIAGRAGGLRQSVIKTSMLPATLSRARATFASLAIEFNRQPSP